VRAFMLALFTSWESAFYFSSCPLRGPRHGDVYLPLDLATLGVPGKASLRALMCGVVGASRRCREK